MIQKESKPLRRYFKHGLLKIVGNGGYRVLYRTTRNNWNAFCRWANNINYMKVYGVCGVLFGIAVLKFVSRFMENRSEYDLILCFTTVAACFASYGSLGLGLWKVKEVTQLRKALQENTDALHDLRNAITEHGNTITTKK